MKEVMSTSMSLYTQTKMACCKVKLKQMTVNGVIRYEWGLTSSQLGHRDSVISTDWLI